MGEIKAGVILKTKFCTAKSDIYSGYINYIDRKEAVRNSHLSEFNLYNDYMGNPDKSEGLFTNTLDELSEEKVKQIKDCFKMAQNNGSLMWQTVISFDNRWLAQNGLYDLKSHSVDKKKMHELTRNCMNSMLEAEGLLHSAMWTASIHYNTDNIHIHIATVEPIPVRNEIEIDGKKVLKGKFKLSSIEKGKSKVVNTVLNQQKENQLINDFIRVKLLQDIKTNPLIKNREFVDDFLRLHRALPDDKRKWMYGMNAIKDLRPLIDNISLKYIQRYHKEDYDDFCKNLQTQQSKYTTAYGLKKNKNNYAENKISDLYQRLGNAILKEVKSYDKTIKSIRSREESIYAETNVLQKISKQNSLIESERNLNNFDLSNGVVTEEVIDILYDEKKYIEKQNCIKVVSDGKEYYCDWSKEYKKSKKMLNGGNLINKDKRKQIIHDGFNGMKEEAEKGNVLAIFDMGTSYIQGKGNKIEEVEANKCYEKAFNMFNKIYDHTEKDQNEFMKNYLAYRIGKMYAQGIGTEQDYKQAAKWFSDSDGGYAKYALGGLYFRGHGVEKDLQHAFNLYSEAVTEAEIPFAHYELGMMYENGIGTEKDSQKSYQNYNVALRSFEKLIEKTPDDKMLYRIAKMYEQGKGIKSDLHIALQYYELAADAGNIDSQIRLFNYHIKEKNEQYVLVFTNLLIEVSDKTNDKRAQYTLGKAYLNGDIGPDKSSGLTLLRKAADQDYDPAQFYLGRYYLENAANLQDIFEGIHYLEKAVENGNLFAQYKLGKLYIEGQHVKKDIHKGINMIKDASDQGNVSAQYAMGKLWCDGKLVTRDIQLAIHYWELAAENKNEYAQVALGSLFLKGDKVKKNVSKAIQYFEQATEQGNDNAEYFLGKIYLGEFGTRKDIPEALRLLESSANKSNQYAQYLLGKMYLSGDIIPKNEKRGLFWLESAAAQGNVYAQQALNPNAGNSFGSSRSMLLALEKALRQFEKSMETKYQSFRDYELLLEKIEKEKMKHEY